MTWHKLRKAVHDSNDWFTKLLVFHTCSHALGTAKALELGETEGAMSGLAIGISGIFTALLALGFEFVI